MTKCLLLFCTMLFFHKYIQFHKYMTEPLRKRHFAFTQIILSFTVFAEKSQERLGNFYVSSENIREGKPELVLNFPHRKRICRNIPVTKLAVCGNDSHVERSNW